MRLSASEIADRVSGIVEGTAGVIVTGAEVDSRRLCSGDLFVALRGARVDGHRFVEPALAGAAHAALVQHDADLAPPPAGRAQIRVTDPLTAYHALAASERAERSWEVVAVTGSVAKTTTKDFVAHLLAPHRRTGASEGNRNSILGLPAQLLKQGPDIEIFVAEAGMSIPGELDMLGAMLRPSILLYTRIAPVHTEFFPDMAGIVRAKAELLRHLDPGGTLVVNHDDPHQSAFADAVGCRVIAYGAAGCAVRYRVIEDRGLLGSRFQLVLPGGEAEIDLTLPGRHQAENLVAAASVAGLLGVSAEQVATQAATLRATARRGRVHRLPAGFTVVDDSYNASPLAVGRMLELLAAAPGRRVAVLGEMYELGEGTLEAHHEIGTRAAAACDVLVAVGALPARHLAEAARAAGLATVHHADDAGAASELLPGLLQPGDVVLVKGSRGVGLDTTVDAITGGEVA